MNFAKTSRIFARAELEGRDFLLEHEVYALLREAGIAAPRGFFWPKEDKVNRTRLQKLPGPTVVLKVVSPLVAHKSDVGGVRFVKKTAAAVDEARRRMMAEVPPKFLAWAKKRSAHDGAASFTRKQVADSLRGVLVLEKVAFEQAGFGSELLLGLRHSREFGPVVTLGAGGIEVEYMNARLKDRGALSMASAFLLDEADILPVLRRLAVFEKLTADFRGRKALLPEAEAARVFAAFQKLGAYFSAANPSAGYTIEEAEVNPFVIRNKKLVPLDGLCRFGRTSPPPPGRPVEALRFLLRPESMAVIGVSEKMNMGHIILNNILKKGFPRERTYVVKPGLAEIEGCRCVARSADLPETVDLFVLTLAAEQSLEVMRELIQHDKARSVIIIAGGLGEKKGSQGLEREIRDLILQGRREGKPGPVVNGGNCLGIYSKPGHYDTTFIPDYKISWPRARAAGLVFISQSGAFLISRLSKALGLEPLYAVSLGNQIDLTASDYLNYLKDDPQARVFGLYIEGFKPGDGLALARAAREAISRYGKQVVVYKAGRTPEGSQATSSHTASVAGDYSVCRAILEQAGVFLTESIFDFENALKGLTFLADKIVRSNRVGLLSNAGFECVIMSDSLKNGERLELASLSDRTQARIAQILSRQGIDKLQDVHNPMDVTPAADDRAFCETAAALIEDEGVDSLVISPLPMTPAMQTLPPGPDHRENFLQEGAMVPRLIELFRRTDKPLVVNIDAGRRYDPMADELENAGVPVFRRSDEAVKFLRAFVHNRRLARDLASFS
jgi:acyl-CoA synthetase (NDP forming)